MASPPPLPSYREVLARNPQVEPNNGIRAGSMLSPVMERSEGCSSSSQPSDLESLRSDVNNLSRRVLGLAESVEAMQAKEDDHRSLILDLHQRSVVGQSGQGSTAVGVGGGPKGITRVLMDDDQIENKDVSVSYFNCSVENFSASMDSIKELCGLPGVESFDAGEIERFSSMITFLKEWKYFVSEPKTINFAHEIGGGQVKDDFDGITLPQFSSAAVPKIENSPEEAICLDSDFVLHAGGPVWAMDWCPRNQEKPNNRFKCEYLAVAAHPPGSTYHKIGVPLTGRGIIQIWCLLSLEENVENCPQGQSRPRGRPKGNFKNRPAHSLERKEELTVRKPRGRPKGTCKKQLSGSENDLNDKMESASPVSTLVLSMSDLVPSDGLKGKEEKEETVRRPRGRPKGSGKKQPCTSENNLNDKIEWNSPGTNGLVPLLSEDLDLGGGELVPSYNLKGKEELAIRRPRGRPKGSGKKPQCTSKNNLNDKMESDSPSNNFVFSTSNLVPFSSDVLGRSELRPRGRPKRNGKKQQCTSENNLNDKMESDSPGNNFVFSTRNLVPLSSDVLGRSELVPFQEELTIQRPRGRPKGSGKKQQRTSVNNLNDKMESDSPGNDFILSTSDLVPLTSGNLGGCELVPSNGVKGEEEMTIRRPRRKLSGSDKKHSGTSENNLNDKMESGTPVNNHILTASNLVPFSSDDLGGGALGMPLPGAVSGKLETSVLKRRRRSSEEPTPTPSECAPTSQGFVALPVSADLNGNHETSPPKDRGRRRKKPFPSASECEQAFGYDRGVHESGLPTSGRSGTLGGSIKPRATATDLNGKLDSSSLLPSSREFEHEELTTVAVAPINDDHYQGQMLLSKEMTEKKFCIPIGSAFPKVVLCLAHMGKVAWDVKWRPASANDSEDKHHLGYLAVLLGNGSLEVWEVPVPNMVKILHASCGSEGTDPRFLKLKPIFRCSKVQCGDRQSIPLTLEWSPSAPHDLILTGCHDGTVALWKFSKQHSSQDIKPLLCFSADCVPIRALAWSPDESDVESVNLMVTAGHEGLKFWDIRDPYRPLCEFCPGSVILSLQWLRDPRCIIMSLDDGELRMLSLWKVANNFLVTGEPPGPSKQTGSFYCCSHSAIWSCQVSRATGTTAYCTADGSARHFKLTTKAVEKDPSRYREPHFLCGSFSSNERTFKIKSPLSKDPLPNIPWKKMITGLGDAPLSVFLSNQLGGDKSHVAGDDQTPPVMKSKSKPRCSDQKSSRKTSNPSKPPCQSLTTEADKGTLQITIGTEEGSAQRIERLPPKDVAIHIVRWNINKGSERWLCYGGAAGIVRCQKIYSGTA